MQPQKQQEYIPVADNPAYAREAKSRAVVLTDKTARNKYQDDLSKRRAEKLKMQNLEAEVANLRKEMNELSSAIKLLKN